MFFVKILGSRDSDHEVTKLKACLESPDKKHWAKTASSFLGCRVFLHSVSSFPTPSSYTQCANSELRHSQHCKKKNNREPSIKKRYV